MPILGNRSNLPGDLGQLYVGVNKLYGQGRQAQAIDVAKQAYDRARQYLEPEHPTFFESLNILAKLYYAIGNYASTIPLLEQILEILRTVGETREVFATALNNLAEVYRVTGKYAAAEPLYRQAIAIDRVALGEQHPGYATDLNNLAELYRVMGNHAAAEPLYHQALAIRQAALGGAHTQVAESLNNLAELYRAMGNYTAAEPLYHQAIEIDRVALGEHHPGYAAGLNNLAELYRMMGNYAAAEPLYHQALEIDRAALGEHHPDYATDLNNLATLYLAMGKYTLAEPLFRQTSQIIGATLGEDHPLFAASLNNLSALYNSMGNYVAAEPLLQQASAILRATLGDKHPNVAQSLNNLAELYRTTGNYAAAEPLYHQALEIIREVLGEDHPTYITDLNNLAGLYKDMGNYAAAEPLYHQALKTQRTVLGENHPSYADSLNSLGELYRVMGDYTKAEQFYRQASNIWREALGELHPRYATSLNNLAVLYDSMGNYAGAEPLYRQALDIRRRVLGEMHPRVATSMSNLAAWYHAIGDYAAAEPLLQQALELKRAVLGPAHPDIALGLNNLAVLYNTLGDNATAEQLHRQALEMRRATLGQAHPDVAQSLNSLAILSMATRREAEAMSLMKEAIVIHDQIIEQVFSISSERQRMAYLRTLQAELAGFLSIVIQHRSASPAAVQVGLDVVLRRKALGAEALAAQREAVLGGRYPQHEPQLRKFLLLRSQIAQKTLAGPGPEGLETHEQLLRSWNAQQEELEAALVRQIPELNLKQRLQTADRYAIAEALPSGGVLIEFVRFDVFNFMAAPARGERRWSPARYLAFILPATEPDNVQLIDLGEAEPIDTLIATFRASITGERESRDIRHLKTVQAQAGHVSSIGSGSALYAAVFAPLVTAFGGRTRLFLAPDGDLSRLPFETLPTSDNRCLIDSYYISYLSTGRDALRLKTTSITQPTDSLVAADPDFDLSGVSAFSESSEAFANLSRDLKRSTSHFSRLRGTHVEGEQIAAMLGVSPLLEGAVLETKLKTCRSPYIIHIATHGFFLSDQHYGPNEKLAALSTIDQAASSAIDRLLEQGLENPLLRSGLALAGANAWLQGKALPVEAEDGILTAEDVSGLDLLATALVVLSACETGLGEVHVGEGVFGLRRAFMLAGAKTLVMSLWKVPDHQTQELMVDFYGRLLQGQPCSDALREAQLTMKQKYANPFYWGAFICQGDPDPLVYRSR